MTLHWDHIDDEAVKTAKRLAADAVEQAGPGTGRFVAAAAVSVPVALLLADLPLEDPAEYAQLVCSLMA